MKTIRLFLATIVVTSLSLASCSSDDNESATGGNIEASWNPTKTTVKVGSDTFTQNYDGNEAGCEKDYIEFAANGILNNVIFFRDASDVCTPNAATPAAWAKSNNTLTISGGSEYEGTYEIIRLNGSDLRIESTSNTGGLTSVTTVYFTKAD